MTRTNPGPRTAAVLLACIAAACSATRAPATTAATPPTPTGTAHHSTKPSHSTVPAESPVPAESNPPGDIPDNTQFIPYHSIEGHFEVKVPEGWSRRTTKSGVSFTDKLNTISATWFPIGSAPTARSATSDDVPMLRRSEPAFRMQHIITCAPSCTIPYSTGPIDVNLTSADAVVITYESNSRPNAVTGKQYRDENLRFEFFHQGEEAAITLSGPVLADNVDPWRLVADSFRWR